MAKADGDITVNFGVQQNNTNYTNGLPTDDSGLYLTTVTQAGKTVTWTAKLTVESSRQITSTDGLLRFRNSSNQSPFSDVTVKNFATQTGTITQDNKTFYQYDLSVSVTIPEDYADSVLHVFFDLFGRPELVVSLHVREVRLEFLLPKRVFAKGVSACGLSLRVEFDKVFGDRHRCFSGSFSCTPPGPSRQPGERRRIARVTDIFLDNIQLLCRDVQNIRTCISDNKIVTRDTIGSHGPDALETSYSVDLVNDIISCVEI